MWAGVVGGFGHQREKDIVRSVRWQNKEDCTVYYEGAN